MNKDKPKSCRNCKIKECAEYKNYNHCFECTDYPCTLIKRLDKSYRTRYDESLINNFQVIKEKGMDYYLNFEKKRFQCPGCGSTLNMHDKKCYECGNVIDVNKLE